MDRIIKYKNKDGGISIYHLMGYDSYKHIKQTLIEKNITNIINVQKYKLCPHCKDGYLEVDDKKGKEVLKCLK